MYLKGFVDVYIQNKQKDFIVLRGWRLQGTENIFIYRGNFSPKNSEKTPNSSPVGEGYAVQIYFICRN